MLARQATRPGCELWRCGARLPLAAGCSRHDRSSSSISPSARSLPRHCAPRMAATAAGGTGSSSVAAGGTAPQHALGKKAVVVGSGPAGALTAMLLAKQGFKVDVFERLAPLVDDKGNVLASIGSRSYNILLSERAIDALDAAGADLSGFDIPRLTQGMRHKLKGGPREGRSSMPPGRLRLANRGTLAGALVQQCLARHPGCVQFHFEQELNMIDTNSGIAFFRPVGSAAQGASMASRSSISSAVGSEASAGGAAVLLQAPPEALTGERTPASADALASYPFDLLVGADGASSLVRQVLQRQDAELSVQVTRDNMEFRTAVLGQADEFLPEGSSAVGTFQTWSNSKLRASLIGSSAGDGQLRCVFILPEGLHATLMTAEDIERYLADAFPSLPEAAIKRAAPQLAAAPISNGGTIVRCSKLYSRRVVLVGDAAHSVFPALGQGANSALEGAATLATVLQEVGVGDIQAALAEYSRRWLPNALAVAELTEGGFGNNARAFAPNLKLAQIISQFVLHKLLPFLVPVPAFMQMNSTTMSYATILKRTKREMVIFKAALVAAAAAMLAFIARHFARPALAALGLA